MRVRAIHLRAILLPLGVAVASIAAVAWYGLVKIPAQQRYITERNLRLLKTKSAQIKSKVDSFDSSIDHALEFFPGNSTGDKAYVAQFQQYVRRFAPGLLVVTDFELEAEKTLARRVGDPPRVIVQRDEGRYFLFLGYSHGHANIVAKTDLEQTLAPFLSTGTEFDALMLVSRDGRVIVQRSSSGLDVVHVDSLRDPARTQAAPAADGKRADPPSLFESLRMSTSIANVTLGNAEYQMYVQPIQLSLNAGEGKHWAGATASEPSGGDVPEEWALCGFVRADHFRAASSSISYTYLLWFGVALVTVCLATPLVKLHMLSPTERLQGGDAVLVAATTFLVAALITFCAIDAYYFHFVVNANVDRTLARVASSIRDHFNDETAAVAAQLEQLQAEAIWRDGLTYGDTTLTTVRSGLTAVEPNGTPPTTISKEGKAFKCEDPVACRDHVLANGFANFVYPFFDLIVFDDQAGWQRIKWSTRGVTPFINIRDAQLPYYAPLKSARQLLEARARDPIGGVSVIQSPNTGEIQTVFWKPLDPKGAGNRREADLIGETMSTSLISMVNPVLPAHVQFAVVDNTGRVVFHADPTRRLQENFFLESEDNPALRAAVSGRRSMFLSAYYLGRSYRMYATPFDLSAANMKSFADPGWTLMVFEERTVAETLNLETLTAALGLFALYSSALALAWVLLHWLGGARFSNWFWPDRSAGAKYRNVIVVNGLLTVVFLGWIARLESTPLLVSTMLLAATGVASTFLLVVRFPPSRTAAPSWRGAFDGARVSYLLVAAVVPAIACFQVAYDFEATLLTRSRQAAVAADLDARDQRIKASAERRLLCGDKIEGEDCDNAVSAFIDVRTWTGNTGIPWDVSAADVEWKEEAVALTAPRVTRLDALLASMHRPYNDVAAEMTAALPADGDDAAAPHRWRQWLRTDDSTKVWLASTPSEESTATLTSTVERALPGAGVWLIVVGLAAALYALVRIVVQPLYALTLWGRPAVGAAEIPLDASAHALLIGPPGAGKTLRLLSQPRIRVFDTRTQSFFERRSATESIPFERRSYAYATAEEAPVFAWSGPAGAQAQPMPSAIEPDRRIDWLDKETLPADPAVLIGVDHLEHSLDSRDDRVRMLRFLEELIYRHQRIVWIAAAREPIGQLQELSDARPDAAEMTRWIRVLQPFREVRVGLADVGLSAEAVDETAAVSAPYYRAVWTSCSKAEQLALRQLADEGVVNPNNGAVVAQLMRSGLVRRTSSFRLASERFRLFVLQALEPGEVTERERAAVALPWASVTTAMLTVALGLGALLVLTSQQLVDAWIGYVPALAPAVPTVMKLLATARQDGKGSLTA